MMDEQISLGRICPVCGSWITRPRARYCSSKCEERQRYQDQREETQEKRRFRYATDPKYPVMIRAHEIARKAHPAVGPCRECGLPGTDRHHDDYSNPDEIVFLCRSHHMRLEAARRRGSKP